MLMENDSSGWVYRLVALFEINPRNGSYTKIGNFKNSGILTFDPPGEIQDGNDWVLVLEGK
jgi:hypothetical protein